jgi:hypothetical protein
MKIHEKIGLIAIYKSPKYKYFISSLLSREPIVQKTPTDCRTTIIGNFKIDIITHTLQSMELQKTMNKYDLKLVSFETTTIL